MKASGIVARVGVCYTRSTTGEIIEGISQRERSCSGVVVQIDATVPERKGVSQSSWLKTEVEVDKTVE